MDLFHGIALTIVKPHYVDNSMTYHSILIRVKLLYWRPQLLTSRTSTLQYT